MVTREMVERGKVIAVMDYDVYKRTIATIRNNLPRHIYISPERVMIEGRKVVKLWCAYPKAGEIAVRRALGEPL